MRAIGTKTKNDEEMKQQFTIPVIIYYYTFAQ